MSGEYNSTDWIVERGTLLGIEAYRVHPPKPPKVGFGSRHCISLFLPEKKNYRIFKIENQILTAVSWIAGEQVKVQDWNFITNVVISQLKVPNIYFFCPSDTKLPVQLEHKTPVEPKQFFIPSYQKLLPGFFSK